METHGLRNRSCHPNRTAYLGPLLPPLRPPTTLCKPQRQMVPVKTKVDGTVPVP